MLFTQRNRPYFALPSVCSLILGVTLFISANAQAAVTVVDDAVFGVGSVLRDPGQNLEYLRLVETVGYGYAGVEAELGSGGDFEGWMIASTAQMESLGTSLGLVHGATTIDQLSLAGQLRDWNCPLFSCVRTTTTHVYARGLVSDVISSPPAQDAFTIGERFNVSPPEVDFRISGFATAGATNEEVFLVRVVPIPAALWLFGPALLSLVVGANRRQRA